MKRSKESLARKERKCQWQERLIGEKFRVDGVIVVLDVYAFEDSARILREVAEVLQQIAGEIDRERNIKLSESVDYGEAF